MVEMSQEYTEITQLVYYCEIRPCLYNTDIEDYRYLQ